MIVILFFIKFFQTQHGIKILNSPKKRQSLQKKSLKLFFVKICIRKFKLSLIINRIVSLSLFSSMSVHLKAFQKINKQHI